MTGIITHKTEMSSVFGPDREDFKPGSVQVVQNNKGQWSNTVSVTTGTGVNATTIAIAGLTTFGKAYFHNLDADNFVNIGVSTSTAAAPELFGKLKATETDSFRLFPGVILRAEADTATVKLKVKVMED